MHASPDLLALLALGEQVGSPDDHAHLSECSECRAELHSLGATAALGRRTSEGDALTSPPPHVWQRIRTELQLEGAGGPVDPPPPPTARTTQRGGAAAAPASRRGVRAASFVLAAALALVVGIGIGTNLDRPSPGEVQVSAVQLNALPPFRGSAGQATVEKDRDGNRTLVVQISSPERATGPRQVWLTNSSADPMVSMGTLTDDAGRFPISSSVDLSTFRLVDVSQEPANDTHPEHSGHSMLRGKLPS